MPADLIGLRGRHQIVQPPTIEMTLPSITDGPEASYMSMVVSRKKK